jgi:hypothetical protein
VKASPIVGRIAPLGLLALAACSRDPTSAPGLHSLTGHVLMTGHVIDDTGQFRGTRVVPDADGVRVELLHGSQVVATTTTTDGAYTFTGLASGAYQARSRVIGNIGDQTVVLTITDTDLVARDTLRLAPAGDLYPVPNPVGVETLVYFELPDSVRVTIRIRDMAGDVLRTLLDAPRPAGINQVRWDGLDSTGVWADAPLYWVTLERVGDLRAQLLFR